MQFEFTLHVKKIVRIIPISVQRLHKTKLTLKDQSHTFPILNLEQVEQQTALTAMNINQITS